MDFKDACGIRQLEKFGVEFIDAEIDQRHIRKMFVAIGKIKIESRIVGNNQEVGIDLFVFEREFLEEDWPMSDRGMTFGIEILVIDFNVFIIKSLLDPCLNALSPGKLLMIGMNN